jgi:hypothetical protein
MKNLGVYITAFDYLLNHFFITLNIFFIHYIFYIFFKKNRYTIFTLFLYFFNLFHIYIFYYSINFYQIFFPINLDLSHVCLNGYLLIKFIIIIIYLFIWINKCFDVFLKNRKNFILFLVLFWLINYLLSEYIFNIHPLTAQIIY